MKKLLFMIAAVVAAVSAQAAYVDWQYSASEAKTGGTDWTSGYTAYLLTATDWSALQTAGVTAAGLADKATDSSTFYVASSGKKIIYSTGAGGSAGVRQIEAASGDYYVILGSATGYTVGIGPAAITAYTDASSAGTGLTPGITKDDGSPATGADIRTAMAASPYSGGGVPEPTSGLLLALGGAMLALRRKRA